MPNLLPRPVKTIEVVLALIVLVHGVIWASPIDTFPLSGNYKVMEMIAPEEVWSIVFLLLGLGWGIGILSRRIIPRRAGLVFGGGALLWMGVSFWLSNPNTIVGWMLLILGIGSFVTRFELR